MPARPLTLALVTGLLAALTACGGTDGPAARPASDPASASPATPASSPAGSPSSSPAADGELAGKGYVLALPAGWQDATDQFQQYSPLIDSGALDAEQAGQAFSDNVNVLRNPVQQELPAGRAERRFADELGTVASRVRIEDRTTVGGVPALHLTGRTRAGKVVALTDQYVAFVDRAYYVITFSYGSGTPQHRREHEVAAMLASWDWA